MDLKYPVSLSNLLDAWGRKPYPESKRCGLKNIRIRVLRVNGALLSLVVSGGQWWLVVVSGGQWWSVVVSGGQWWSVVVSGGQWWSVVVSGGQWWSVVVSGGQSLSLETTTVVSRCHS